MLTACLRNLCVASTILLGVAVHANATNIKDLQAAGTIKTATAEAMPYSGLTADGKPTGYNLELSQRIWNTLGVPAIDPVIIEYQAMIPGLQANRWDMIAATLDITSARCEVILFTNPVIVKPEGMIVGKGNPKNIKSHDDFVNDSSLRLAVVAGSSQRAYAHNVRNIPQAQLVEVAADRDIINAVTSGRADAGAFGYFALFQMTNNERDQKVVEPMVLEDVPLSAAGFIFRKQDRELRDLFDGELQKLRISGELGELVKKWDVSNQFEQLKTARSVDISPNCE